MVMTATDELCKLLDERGADYRVSATGYSIDIGPYTTAYANRSDTTLDVSLRQVTPAQAIEATLGPREQPPYDELIEALRRDWDIEASWDGLRRFWYVGLTDEGVRKRDEREATLRRGVTGDTSDGYHTFNELYHHRAVLFSVIVRMMPDKAWKSKLHHTGDMFDGMFIVGIETPSGQATYHYDIDPYWEMFDCKELERAPEWDGHTPSQAIERIATLGRGVVSE